jgi:delta-aminolevulinic acid dehydratase/porphobilinogen synthase
MDELEEKKRKLRELQQDSELAKKTGVLPELVFPGSTKEMGNISSAREKNYRDALEAVMRREAEEKALKGIVSDSLFGSKMDSLVKDPLGQPTREPSGVLNREDRELDELANVIATPYQPSEQVKEKINSMRETDPSRFAKLKDLIVQKLNQTR